MVTLSKSNDNELEQAHFPTLSEIKVTCCKGIYVRLKKVKNELWACFKICIFLLIVLVISSRRLLLAGAPQNLHSLPQLVLDLFFITAAKLNISFVFVP